MDYALFDAAQVGCGSALLMIQEGKRRDFEAHLAPPLAMGLDIHLVDQPIDLRGVPRSLTAGRAKPWGTGFAVLAAKEHLDVPFVVCNADDFYGRGAFAAVTEVLRRMSASGAAPRTTTGATVSVDGVPPILAVTVGYRLDATLSDSGGVSRGVCQIDEDGTLRTLTEGLNLHRVGSRVCGNDSAGNELDVGTDSLVCTSLWGFQPGIFELLGEQFRAFLANDPGPEAEFYLTEAVNHLIATRRVRCTVLPTDEPWLGVTFPGDREGVAHALRRLVESGTYPERLWVASKPSPA